MAQVIWQESAIAHLQSIYHYYYEHKNPDMLASMIFE